jgi:phosphoribosylglycinamide formyltransferase-1
MGDTDRLRIAILASGSGSNLEAVVRACLEGRVAADAVAALSNRPDALALERARRLGVPAIVADHRALPDRQSHEERIIELLEPFAPHLVVLAGYMRIVTATLIERYHGRFAAGLPGVMNIHPADTRAYQGAHGYEFALGLAKGHRDRLSETKITVHFVDSGVDTGPIIAQRTVPVLPDDTLETLRGRGLEVEHQLYPECVELYARRRLEVVGRTVRVRESSEPAVLVRRPAAL